MFGDIDPDSLCSAWKHIQKIPFVNHEIRIDARKYGICSKDENIYDFFTFFKLITTHRTTFDNAVNSFFVHNDVCKVDRL